MSLSTTIYLGPIITCDKFIISSEKKIKTCHTADCKTSGPVGKFCNECGSIVYLDSVITEEYGPDIDTEKLFEEKLYAPLIEGNDDQIYLLPNVSWGNKRNCHINSDMFSLEHIPEILISKEILQFNIFFKKEIDELNEIFNKENVKIIWGLFVN